MHVCVCVCVCGEREREHTIMEAGKSKMCVKAGRLETRGRVCWQNSLFFQRGQSFSIKTFNCLDEARSRYGWSSALLKVCWFKYYSHLKHTFTGTSRIILGQLSGYCGPAKWTQRISHHTRWMNGWMESWPGSPFCNDDPSHLYKACGLHFLSSILSLLIFHTVLRGGQ